MRRFIVSTLALIAPIAVAMTPSTVKADTFPAITGRPLVGSEEICFQGADFSSRVTNFGCSTSPAPRWFVPMVLRFTGTTTFRASSTGAGVAPICRVMVRSAGDSFVFMAGPVSVVGSDMFLGSFNVTNLSNTALVQCNLEQAGRSLTSVRWHL